MERWRCPACNRIRRKDYHAKVEIGEGAPQHKTQNSFEPYLVDPDVTLYNGDSLDVLKTLPDGCVDMVATSPPFWSLRDYQAEGQIGLEETIDEWVAQLCDVFDECRRVLADHGSCWIEIGDSFDSKQLVGQPWRLAFALQARGWFLRSEIIWARLRPNPMPESVTDRPTKSHSTVFLLSKRPRYFYDADAIREPYAPSSVERSQYARDDIRSGSVGELRQTGEKTLKGGPRRTDLPRLSLPVPQSETLDGSGGESPRGPDGRRQTTVQKGDNSEQHRDGERWPNPSGANARSVWTVPTEPTPFAHFATWPQALVRRMILAGTSEKGCCPECGAPWVRQTERDLIDTQGWAPVKKLDHSQAAAEHGVGRLGNPVVKHLGWAPTCAHELEPAPCVVLDPFGGSGTTALVARGLNRRSILIELNPDYCNLAADRLAQQSLFTEAY